MNGQEQHEKTQGIYNFESLKKAYLNNSHFDFVIFNDFNEKDVQLNPVTVGCLSQFFPVTFTDEKGIQYITAHQYMTSQRALLFNDQETFNKIIYSRNSHEINQLGQKIKNFNKKIWYKNEERIVYQGNSYKFNQNDKLKEFILSFPPNTIFVNADPNNSNWGIQLHKNDPSVLDPSKWKGYNKLGFILTKLRDDFLLSQKEKISLSLQPSSTETNFTRDVPVYLMTDIHMNQEPLNGIVELNDGIVALNGDVVTGVTFLHNRQQLGTKYTKSIRRTIKGTWTDPEIAIEILGKRNSKYPLIVGFGNHEVNTSLPYLGSSITCLKDWIESLKKINAVPLCSFPDYSHLGVGRFYKFGNTYFFSYITSKIAKNEQAKIEYENSAISEISEAIQKVCDPDTKEIFLLCHADSNEGGTLAKNVVYELGKFQLNNKLTFDLMKINFTFCLGHNHWGSVKVPYRVNKHYWEGVIILDVLNQKKNINCVYPNCADDCIKIESNMEKSVKACFITKRNL